MSGVITAIGVAASVASAAYSMTSGGAGSKVSTSAADSEVSSAASAAKKARSALLETAGGQAGENLSPGQTASNKDTLFGN